MKNDDIRILIVLLLLDIALTFRSAMLGLYSSVWSSEGKIALMECYANSLNILSGIILFGALIVGIIYIKNIKIKFMNKFLIFLLVAFSILFFYFWIFCDTALFT
jgi:hypothetical protein